MFALEGKNIFIRKMVSGGGKKTETPPALASQLNANWRIKFKQQELHFCLATTSNNELTACFSVVCFCAPKSPCFKLIMSKGALLESILRGVGPQPGLPKEKLQNIPWRVVSPQLESPLERQQVAYQELDLPSPLWLTQPQLLAESMDRVQTSPGYQACWCPASYRLICHHLGFLHIKVRVCMCKNILYALIYRKGEGGTPWRGAEVPQAWARCVLPRGCPGPAPAVQTAPACRPPCPPQLRAGSECHKSYE